MSTKQTVQSIAIAIKNNYNQMRKSGKVILPASNKSVQKVMSWGKIPREEACLFSYFAALAINGDQWFNLTDIQNYIDCEAIDYCSYIPAMDNLLKKGFFSLRYDFMYHEGLFNKDTQFYMHPQIEELITYNKAFQPYFGDVKVQTDTLSFLYRCKKEGFNSRYVYYKETIKGLYSDNAFLMQFIKDEIKFPKGTFTAQSGLLFFIRAGMYLVDGQEMVSVRDTITESYEMSLTDIANTVNTFKTGTNWFIKSKIFEINKANLGDDITISWGDKAKKDFYKGNIGIFLNKSDAPKEVGRISYKNIAEKELFYNEKNQNDINRIEGLLSDKSYNEIRARLEEKHMPKGVIILMHGAPGTGKTETAMQLGRKTGRDVLHVNISEIRSCWVGESEKNVKKIFKSYTEVKGKKPILLFNEADAIVSKRTANVDGENSSVNKMENAMQNIILEEFENFDGICILTTNLVDTIDEAFDRRILFKMKFENPTKDVKKKIWKSKIESLSDTDLEALSDFDFSGGQIENIRRKITIDEILYGSKPSLDTLVDFCKKEKLHEDKECHIGFGAS